MPLLALPEPLLEGAEELGLPVRGDAPARVLDVELQAGAWQGPRADGDVAFVGELESVGREVG